MEFEQNEMKWAAQLMKSKKLQKIMVNFTEQIADCLDHELKGSLDLAADWVQYPHSQSGSPARNQR